MCVGKASAPGPKRYQPFPSQPRRKARSLHSPVGLQEGSKTAHTAPGKAPSKDANRSTRCRPPCLTRARTGHQGHRQDGCGSMARDQHPVVHSSAPRDEDARQAKPQHGILPRGPCCWCVGGLPTKGEPLGTHRTRSRLPHRTWSGAQVRPSKPRVHAESPATRGYGNLRPTQTRTTQSERAQGRPSQRL